MVVGLFANMEGKGRDVGDCTSFVVRHHGAQCTSPRRPKAEAGEADEVPGCCERAFRVGEVEGAGHRLKSDRVVVHVHGCEGGRVCVLIRRPRGGRLDGVENLQ